MEQYSKILIIQTAFIGDVILASALVESLHQKFPNSRIDFCLRKGNEGLLEAHPIIKKKWIWNKNENKFKNLFKILFQIRAEKYDLIIVPQRFFSAGLLTAFSGAKVKSGFKKNPLSFMFNHKANHEIGNGTHEIERNHQLISFIKNIKLIKPKIYPPKDASIDLPESFITIAPSSVWFTKAFPFDQWVKFCNSIPEFPILILGAPNDEALAQKIIAKTTHSSIKSLCGKINLLESASIMSKAKMNYVNDSAPLHLCSATNAPVTAIFCSTLPSFGFTPLSDEQYIIETKSNLDCRPCGLHGKKACPLSHFKCGYEINIKELKRPLIQP